MPRLGYQEGTVEISGSDPSELDRQLHELVQRRLAVGDQQITLDWWEHPFEVPTVMEGQRRINYVALRNEFASRSLKSLQRAGLSVVCVDSPGFVAARLLQMQGIPSSDYTALVLEITHQATRLTCVYQDLPVYSRTLSSLGWDAACAEVAKQYRVTSREAIVLLNRYGRSSRELNGDQLLIRTLLQDAAGDYRRMLTHELYRTISYLDQKLRLPSVATCLMVGEHARQVFAIDAVSELVPVETTLHEIRQADQVETMLSSEEWGNALSLSWLGYEARRA